MTVARGAAPAATAVRRYDVHGVGLVVECDDEATLGALGARLRHFAADGGGPAHLHVELRRARDARALTPPPAPRRPVYDLPVGEVSYARDGRLFLDDGAATRFLCDPSAGRVVGRVGETAEARCLAAGFFFTIALYELLRRRERFGLHAAAAARGGRAILFPGASGAGKSTLALALACGGFELLGDDMCFLASRHGRLRVLAFPGDVDVHEDAVRLLPGLPPWESLPVRRGDAKRPVRADCAAGAAVARDCVPAAVVFPRVAGTRTSALTEIAPADALLSLAPHVLLTEPRASQAHLDVLARLVRDAPCFRLDTGRDLDALPDRLGRLL